jgi:glycosyltransferase involved in cell wall biosynthesis
MTTPLVSVNMAAYNAAPYIAEAIQSVINQTFQNWELIIINDCSTDTTAAEIAKFSDPRIKVFHNEQNEGIVYTRNRALHYSQGNYIAVLDADDVFLNAKLEVQVDFMEKHPDYGMTGTAFQIMDQEQKTLSKIYCWYAKPEYFPAILLFNNYFVHSSVLFKTELAKDILYKPLIKGCAPGEEYQLFVEIARSHKLYNINRELVHYRQHALGISKVREDKIKEYIDIIVKSQLKRLNITPDQAQFELHKSIHFAFSDLQMSHIRNIKKWMNYLIKQNNKLAIYDSFFEEYLARKWYDIAKFNANYGLRMLQIYFSSSLSYHKAISFNERKFLIERCLYEFKIKLFKK